MHDTTALLVELGSVILGLGIIGRFAGRIGLSPIPLYLLAGLAFGDGGCCPSGPARSSPLSAPRSASFCCCSCWGWSTARPSW